MVNVSYWESQCAFYFPPEEGGFGSAQGKTPEDVNKFTGGWSATNMTRILFVNGQHDPWRDSTMSSINRPGGPLQSTTEVPVKVIPGGTHCSDLYGQNWAVNPELKSMVDEEIAILSGWVDDYYTLNNKARP